MLLARVALAQLAEHARFLGAVLPELEGGLPDLHLGVVSSAATACASPG